MLEQNGKVKVGYHLYDCGDSGWEFYGPTFSIKGTWQEVCQFAAFEFDFESKELYIARREMSKYGHDMAIFGIMKSFMWSCKKGGMFYAG